MEFRVGASPHVNGAECSQAAVMQFLLAATMNSLWQLLDLDAGPVDTGVLVGVIGDQCPPALLGA
jgi:hypothetical protein